METARQTAWLSDYDLHLFAEGTHRRVYDKLGAHCGQSEGSRGVYFALWAPGAAQVSVIGDFNSWRPGAHPLMPHPHAGVWEGFVPEAWQGTLYKYAITSRTGERLPDKADPYGFSAEAPPHTASRVWDLNRYQWNDGLWMARQATHNGLDQPISIYQVHLASWRRMVEQRNRPLTYRELAEPLADYVHDAGYTHVEFLPLTDLGFYAPSSRFGPPEDLMYLVDHLHQREIGVVLDWTPANFPLDEAGLALFDGTPLYEDGRSSEPPAFHYGRPEVRQFLTGNALFWLDRYHVDGLHVDGLARMLYLDYGRADGQWLRNPHGGNENLDALQFVRQFNEQVYGVFPDCFTIAGEPENWPLVSRPVYAGGLGFGLKWNKGWRRGILSYLAKDPMFRRYNHTELTGSAMYGFAENFVLPLSREDVTGGKGSLLSRMPGDEWREFANLRLLLAYQFGCPGKKLMFMGGEFGQWSEWREETSLDWHLLGHPLHAGVARWARDLNTFYRGEPSLEVDHDAAGFELVDAKDFERSVIAFLRRGTNPEEVMLVVFNFTPVPRANYRVGVPRGGFWSECLNSDALLYGGSGQGNLGGAEAAPLSLHGQPFSLSLTLPPLGALFLRGARGDSRDTES